VVAERHRTNSDQGEAHTHEQQQDIGFSRLDDPCKNSAHGETRADADREGHAESSELDCDDQQYVRDVEDGASSQGCEDVLHRSKLEVADKILFVALVRREVILIAENKPRHSASCKAADGVAGVEKWEREISRELRGVAP